MKIFNETYKDILLILITVFSAISPFISAYFYDDISLFGVIFLIIFLPILYNVHLNASFHYHIHRPIFNIKLLNSLYEYLSSSVAFVGYQDYKFIHIEHHKYVNDKLIDGKVGDPVSTYRWGNGKEETFLSYIFKTPFRNIISGSDLKCIENNFSKKVYRIEQIVKLLSIIIIGLINFKFIPLYFIITHSTWVMNNALSYSEHYNAIDPEDTKRDSTSCYNKIYNFLFFNTGYHQEHHYRPGIHWTKLPELRQQLPENRNIVKYCLYNNNPYHA